MLFEQKSKRPRLALLLRLPPTSVALTPEVRCAVVGNVDSGKSTTLGVLTRGALRVRRIKIKHDYMTLQGHWTTEGDALESVYSDTNTKSKRGGLPVLVWRYMSAPIYFSLH